jgi:DNA-binding MarR family transcriptional regulator
LIDKLEHEGGKLIFMIDELDKVDNDTALSDFFDGNQAWFQGKQGMISLSYTFGKSLSKTLVTSASRISLIESFPGIASPEDAGVIIRKRIKLGLSQIKANEEEAEGTALKIMPDETVKAILNVSALNSHILLERTSQAIDRAIRAKAKFVSPDHVSVEPEEQAIPTSLEASILRELTACKLSPSVISDRLQKDRGLTTRTLQKLMTKNWVDRHGEGKRAYYFITPKGEAAYRRAKT